MCKLRGSAVGLFLVIATIWVNTAVSHAETIQVVLRDGRVMQGEPDTRTDSAMLWLRSEVTGVQLRSGFRWEQIEVVLRGNSSFTPAEFQRIAAQTATPSTSYLDLAPHPPREFPPNSEQCLPQCASTPPRWQAGDRVRSLQIECCLANWNSSAESDGVRIVVSPLSASGELVPVEGQLDAQLFGELTNLRGNNEYVHPEFRQLGEWHHIVHLSDFANGPAVYELPFTTQWHPDFEPAIADQGVLHARLGVPSMGVFEASHGRVFLREPSMARDRLQLYTGQRYFPGEHPVWPGR
jgi:hypothetical protein